MDRKSTQLHAVDLHCEGCGKRYRLIPRGTRLPQGGITCPGCRHHIPLTGAANTPPPLPAARRADEGGADLLKLLGDQENFTRNDASTLRPIRPRPERSLGSLVSASALYDLQAPGWLSETALPPLEGSELNLDLEVGPAVAVRIGERALPGAAPPPRARVGGRALLLSALLLALLLAGVSSGLWTPYGYFGLRALVRPPRLGALAQETGARAQERLSSIQLEGAREEAAGRLRASLGPPADQAPGVARLARALASQGDRAGAEEALARALSRGLEPGPLLEARVDLLSARGEHAQARQEAWEALSERGPMPEVEAALGRALRADPGLWPPLRTALRPGRQLDALRYDQAADALRGALAGRPTGTLTEARRGAAGRARAAVFGWRLCAALRCAVVVPKAEAARLDVQDLEALLPPEEGVGPWRQGAIIHVGDAGAWLSGSWAAPSPADSPRLTLPWARWRGWLEAGAALDGPAEEALGALQASGPREEGAARAILADRPLAWVALQLSQMVVLDHLLGVAPREGAPLLLEGLWLGELHRRDPRGEEARGRLGACERFSRRQIMALRALSAPVARVALVDQGEPEDEALLRELMARREEVLERVDALIARRGEREVLSLP